MGYQAGLKGIVAQMIGGMGNVPGAIAGSLLLGLIESYGIAIVRHQLPQPVRLRGDDPDPGAQAERHLQPRTRACRPSRSPAPSSRRARRCACPGAVVVAAALVALALPLVVRNGYVLQTLGIGWLYAILAISLTLVAGTAGHDLARARGAARDRRLCLGPAGDQPQASGRRGHRRGGLHHGACSAR